MSSKLQKRRRGSAMGGSVIALLLFTIILAACSSNGAVVSNSVQTPPSATATATRGRVRPPATSNAAVHAQTTTLAAQSGAQPCPVTVSDPAHWDPIIPTQAGTSKVESVTCGNLTGSNTLQALITVRHNVTAATLDVYVYDNIIAANPTQLFSLMGLYNGDARISVYNTIITAEVDVNSSVNKGQPSSAYQRDLCREFAWFRQTGTFEQVGFPGIFPDLTRYQAEADQQQVNGGRDAWKLSAAQTAQMFAAQELQWPAGSPATVVKNDGKNAMVTVQGPAAGGSGSIQVNMSRLEGNTTGGIWIVTLVTSPNLTISQPVYRSQGPFPQVSSPLTVMGAGNAFEGVVGQVKILDHTYTVIGQAQARATGTNGMGNVPYAANVSFTSTFAGGVEEGVIMLYAISNADGSIAGTVMFKVLLG
jgi:hypothetical protein